MPEYILPGKEIPEFKTLDQFTQGYIECMFFTESEQLDAEYQASPSFKPTAGEIGFGDIAPADLETIIKDCRAFQLTCGRMLDEAYMREGYTATRAGHDFWLTRNRHGGGFWDRDCLALSRLGEVLTDAADDAGEVNVYLGDDGKVHL